MTIETKYNIGDEVWVLVLGKIKLAQITAINVRLTGESEKPEVYYETTKRITGDICFDRLPGRQLSQLFSTREALIQSL